MITNCTSFISAFQHMRKKGICTLIFISEGRLKSPPIDRSSLSESIAGDFNRPSNVTIIPICGIAAFITHHG
jgi:hypothetical protein